MQIQTLNKSLFLTSGQSHTTVYLNSLQKLPFSPPGNFNLCFQSPLVMLCQFGSYTLLIYQLLLFLYFFIFGLNCTHIICCNRWMLKFPTVRERSSFKICTCQSMLTPWFASGSKPLRSSS